jgi:beta-lactamase class A
MQRRLLMRRGPRLLVALTGVASPSSPASPAHAAGSSCGLHLSDRLASFAQRYPSIDFAIAVHDLTNGRYYEYRRHAREITASIVKVEILDALLHRHPGGLSPRLSDIARGMIERSDNSDAQTLYKRVGSAAGLRAFGRLVGLRETSPAAGQAPGYPWGGTLTTPADQLRLLALLPSDNAVLSHGDRLFALRLMRHVEPDQRWGITTGTGDSIVAVKNGWLPLTNWQINSIGYVTGTTRRYLIAIESRGAATMQSGVHVVNRASVLVANHC